MGIAKYIRMPVPLVQSEGLAWVGVLYIQRSSCVTDQRGRPMKVRRGFVTNSSSTCYLVGCWFDKETIEQWGGSLWWSNIHNTLQRLCPAESLEVFSLGNRVFIGAQDLSTNVFDALGLPSGTYEKIRIVQGEVDVSTV